MSGGLILDGVPGAGQTRLLQLLLASAEIKELLCDGPVIEEDHTFGELPAELQDPALTDIARCARLRRVMQRLAARYMERSDGGFLLERFHPSYYLLMPQWKLYRNIDAGLSRLGTRLVMLTMASETAQGRASRDEFLRQTSLPSLVIETDAQEWSRYAAQIIEFWRIPP